jgi:hypothetical protein
MTSIISPFVCGTRNLLSQGFRSLPVLIGGSVLILGMAQGNINLLFFFVGLCILSPTSALLINMLWELVFSNTPSFLTVPFSLWKLDGATAEACGIYSIGGSVPPTTLNAVPSYWMTMIAFFYVYLYSNAHSLYDMKEVKNAPKIGVEARKSQTMASMVIVIVGGILTTLLRFATGCETALGILLSWFLGSFLAHYWYKFMRRCGLGRLDDIFGINNRILPMQSYETKEPTVCLPS